MIEIACFNNGINKSNCYIVTDGGPEAFVVDPGALESGDLVRFIENKHLDVQYIILSHSHFDHIASVNIIRDKFSAKIISSKLCSTKCTDPVKNLSAFTEYGTISIYPSDIFTDDLTGKKILWGDNNIFFFDAPGHTKCSICIYIDGILFSGDTLLKNISTKVTFPDGNKNDLRNTINLIYQQYNVETVVYPGHGDHFILGSQEKEVSLNI